MENDKSSESGSSAVGRPDFPEEVYEQTFSFRPLIRTLWAYRSVIVASVAGVLLLFLLWSGWTFVRQPSERQAQLEFRLVFEGADRNLYPNGANFSRADLIGPPVLTEVFRANDLERYYTYEEFKNGFFVLDSSTAVELLGFEYQAKLADARLTAPDRLRLEEEFLSQRDALRVPQYSLNFTSGGRQALIPDVLMSKVLNDVLVEWADQASTQKGVLSYQVRLPTVHMLRDEFRETDSSFVKTDILRGKVTRFLEDLGDLENLPGVTTLRVGGEGITLPELRGNLEDLLRYRLEPLTVDAALDGAARDPEALDTYLEARLFQIELDRDQVARMGVVLEESLQQGRYSDGDIFGAGSGGPANSGQVPGSGQALGSTTTLIPQIGDSFLDRVIAMVSDTDNTEYRQRLTDRMIGFREEVVIFDREASYYEHLREMVRESRDSTGGAQVTGQNEALDTRFAVIESVVVEALTQTNVIYEALSSQNLNPQTSLFAVTSPFTVSTVRAFSIRMIGVYGLLTLAFSLLAMPLACLIHYYFRREVLPSVVVR